MATLPHEEDQDRSILQVLHANAASSFGLEPGPIRHLIVRFLGALMEEADILIRLRYLADLGYVAKVDSQGFHTEIHRYRITAAGINWLRERGL